MAEGFEFKIRIAGLVVWVPTGDGTTGSLLAVRSPAGNGAHANHRHSAAFAYPLGGLVDTANEPTSAPDPLVADLQGETFARRELVDEILRIEPDWAEDHAQPLTTHLPNLLSLTSLDGRAQGVSQGTLGSNLAGTSAIARLDLSAGELSEDPTATPLPGPWQIRGSNQNPIGNYPTLPRLAPALELSFKGVRAVTVDSNKGQPLRFNKAVTTSYTVEPTFDHGPPNGNALPHFEQLYNVMTWPQGRPPHPLKPFRVPVTKPHVGLSAVKGRACPPGQE